MLSGFLGSIQMKISAIASRFVFCALACGFCVLSYGQGQPPVTVAPGAPVVQAPAGIPSAVTATPQPSTMSPDTVVAEVNGKKYTKAELDKVIATLPQQYQKMALVQPQLLSQVFLMQHLAEEAEKRGLDQKEPLKSALELQRLEALSTAELSDVRNTMVVPEDEEQQYYRENQDKFKEVNVRVIRISFAAPSPGGNANPPADGKKPLTEDEAKAKIEGIAKQIQGGADFGKLAHDVSDDKASAAKDGDFGVITPESAYPQAIKTAVFALKQGEVSAPIKEANSFYLVRAEQIQEKNFNQSVMQIMDALKQAKFQQWVKGLQSQYNLKIENPAYFAPRLPAPVPTAH
jgi:peptidyl-prolyl cis-trans isomerase C